LLSTTIYQSLFIVGAGRTRAGNAALIVSTTPLFTAFFSWLRKEERFTTSGVVGLFLAMAGIGLIVWGDRAGAAQGSSLLGDLLVLAASICWALYTIGSKPVLHAYGSIRATAITMVLGTPVLMAVCAPSMLRQDWSRVRPASWAGLTYSALLSIVLAYIIWNYGVRRIGSTRTAIYSNLTPVIGLLIAWPALGEVPAAGQVVGVAVIFVSIYMVRRGAVAVIPGEAVEQELQDSSFPP
jgi:drug/metabolite transporter (DMT)-like permease